VAASEPARIALRGQFWPALGFMPSTITWALASAVLLQALGPSVGANEDLPWGVAGAVAFYIARTWLMCRRSLVVDHRGLAFYNGLHRRAWAWPELERLNLRFVRVFLLRGCGMALAPTGGRFDVPGPNWPIELEHVPMSRMRFSTIAPEIAAFAERRGVTVAVSPSGANEGGRGTRAHAD
jgi:hypothetical protein